MPSKKAASKKVATKLAVSLADAEELNNGEKEVAKILQNDASKEVVKSKVTKRSSGRARTSGAELDVEGPPSKKPTAKGRGKRKSNENEVLDNKTASTQFESQEINEKETNEEIRKKPSARGGGKKAEPKTEQTNKAKENKMEAGSTDGEQKENNKKSKEAKLPEKNMKAVSGRKKKEEVISKSEEKKNIKQKIEEEFIEEKVLKKSSRSSKKSEENATELETQKKKGRISKKVEPVEKDDIELTVAYNSEIEADVEEKKTTKRGRIAKAVIETEEIAVNGESEEILPKKRSRKAPSIEKETVKEKKGRVKKVEKIEEEIEKDPASMQGGEAENETNGQVKQKKPKLIQKLSSSIKKAKKQTESAAASKPKGGRKRAAPSTNNKKTSKTAEENGEEPDDGVNNTGIEDEADGSKPSKTKKSKTNSTPLNATATKYNIADFDLPQTNDGQTSEEPRFNLKISSWNVAGLRSWLKKDGLKFLDYEQPDIFCMQETKCTNDQLPDEIVRIPGYHPYWLCMPGGYAGVAIYSKIMPINVEYGIGNKEFDNCGRIITAEYEKFFLINVYVPNSGRKLVNLETRMIWEKLFQQFVQNLDARKPVVICGDMNVSHQEHDLANPKTNTRNAGFTKEERDKMSELLALGFVDTFRHLYPELKGAYTFWTYMGNARSRNVGWRLDYFIVSERFIKRVVDNCIRSQCMGSDHCPITLFLKL